MTVLSAGAPRPLSLPAVLMTAQAAWLAALLIPLMTHTPDWTLPLDTVSLLALGNAALGIGVTAAVTRTIWDARMLLYISLTMFNVGALIAHVFDPAAPIVIRYFTDVQLAHAGYYLTVCLAAWTLATVLTAILIPRTDATATPTQLQRLRTVGMLFLLAGTVPALLELMEAVQIVRSGGYMALYQQDVVVGVGNWRAVLAVFFIPGLLFLLGSGTLTARGRRGVLLTILLYVGVRIALGHRSGALMPLIATWFLWHRLVRPIPARLTVTVGLLIFMVLLPAVAILRNTAGIVDLSPDAVITTVTGLQSPLLSTLFETGANIMPTAYTMDYIPGARTFGYGLSYLTSLWTALPSIGGLNPGLAGDGPYAVWLVRAVDPGVASLGGGYGFSPMAEAYANFGLVGGVIGFLAVGLLVQGLLTRFSRPTNALHVVLMAVTLSFLLLWARGESVSYVRPIVWFVLLPALYVMYRRRDRLT
ncbi:O-antigen polysaccharide polymerase Wzy [Deinococcus sp. KSM4-11]|uniref:O-antigen polysaccharide polymerase Wzy n=1 Tax=Deinococcus sp. KSM4-11 TaxID=2568654 RepID=UPI0010A2BDFF|nr:O-antigen polysaccharide polymerase Wzy [Deinococcus sp. KSM4-11]THF87148.1 O-antigen polysaccharide polymerase Wzy [Deinococcus sp. KSM4-11]